MELLSDGTLMVRVDRETLDSVNRVIVECGLWCKTFYQDALEIHPASEPPEIGVTVIVFSKQGGVYPAVYYGKQASKNGITLASGWWKVGSKSHYCDPVAWMPKPKIPKEMK